MNLSVDSLGSSLKSRVIYYWVNHDRSFIALAYQSVESLRRYNSNIPVIIFVEESAYLSVSRHFIFPNTTIIPTTFGYKNIFMPRWQCLEHIVNIGFEQIAYFDADTIFYKDVGIFFDYCRSFDFSARREIYTSREGDKCQIKFDRLEKVLEKYRAREVPIFNTGVASFSRKAAEAMVSRLDMIADLDERFLQFRVEYPSRNLHIANEIAMTVILGTSAFEGLNLHEMDSLISPFFLEYSLERRRDPGVVMHYWSAYAHLKSTNPFADPDGSRPASARNEELP